MFRKIFYVFLYLFGLENSSIDKIYNFFIYHKGKLFVISFLSIIIPFLEISFISSLYFTLSDTNQLEFIDILNNQNFVKNYFNTNNILVFSSILSFVILISYLLFKLYHSYLISILNFLSFKTFSTKLLITYLNFPLDSNFKDKRQKLTNAVAVESARYGNVIMEVLMFFSDFLTALVFMISAIYLSPAIFIVCCLLGSFTFILNKNSYAKAREIGKVRIKQQENFFSFMIDLLSGMREIKINASELKLIDIFKSRIIKNQTWRFDNKWNAYKIIIITQSVIYLLLLFVITLGIHFLTLEISLLITFLILIGRLQRVIITMQNHYLKIKQNLPSLRLLDELLVSKTKKSLIQLLLKILILNIPIQTIYFQKNYL